jgi:phosphatidylglycerophosphate synthase
LPSTSDTRAAAPAPRGRVAAPGAGAAPAATPAIALVPPAALLGFAGGTVLSRLVEQLASVGVHVAHAACPPGAEAEVAAALPGAEVHAVAGAADELRLLARLARAGTGPLAVVDGGVVTQREALARLFADPRVATGVLAGRAEHAPPLRVEGGRVVSAGSPAHAVTAPTGAFLGVLRVAAADRPRLADAAERLAGPGAADVAALLVVGLVRSGAAVSAVDLRTLAWARPRTDADAAAAGRAVAASDEERDRLDAAVKDSDGFFTTFFVSPYSRYVARWAARAGLSPNQVTVASMVLGVLAAAGFATGERWGLIAGAIVLQAAFALDCVDGQLARYSRRFSAFGAWLDSIFDRAKEYLAYAGLAIGASRMGDPAWTLAACALGLQTVRHTMDFAGAALAEERAPRPLPPLEQEADGLAVPAVHRSPLARWNAGHGGALLWLRKAIAFPIGERFAVISLTAALFTPRTTFVALLAWGGVAAAYSTAGRILRSVRS